MGQVPHGCLVVLIEQIADDVAEEGGDSYDFVFKLLFARVFEHKCCFFKPLLVEKVDHPNQHGVVSINSVKEPLVFWGHFSFNAIKH